jgi:NAD(P)-dependent dehydrogenase (short-subunit alcohol dehydrogenase family)
MAAAGRVALVTGGATGIGRATCRALVAGGAEVIFINYATSADAAEELATELRALGAIAVPVQADIADPDGPAALIERVADEAGALDHLVNNAGVTELIPFTDLDAVTPEVWWRLWQTNVMGTFACCRAAAPLLRASRGSIVNVSSISARRGVGSSIPYGATKAAVSQLTRSLAVALAPEVRVNAISAGTVRTGWHDRLVGPETMAARAEAEGSVVPLGRIAEPEDIADAIVGLLTSPFVTGEDLLADGGKSLLY